MIEHNQHIAPPIAKRRPNTREIHGQLIEDPYSWLKDPGYPDVSDPEILKHLEDENRYFQETMSKHKETVESLFEELKERKSEDEKSVPFFKNGFFHQWRFEKGDQYRRWFWAEGKIDDDPDKLAWKILLDENKLAAANSYFRLGALSISPNNELLAFSTDTTGDERFDIYIVQLVDKKKLLGPIENTIGNVIWREDSAGFLFTSVNDEWRPYRISHQPLENSPPKVIIEEKDPGFFLGMSLSQSEDYVFLGSSDHVTSETRFIRRNDFDSEPQLISVRREGHEYDVDHRDDKFFLRSNKRHPNFDIFSAPVTDFREESWTLLVEGDQSTYITDFLCLKSHLIVCTRKNGLDQILIKDYLTNETEPISFSEESYTVSLGTNPVHDSSFLRLNYSSMVTPDSVIDYEIASHKTVTRKQLKVPTGYTAELYITERVKVEARDKTKIPVSLVRHRNTTLDGKAPLYLYGYGAYGLSIPPNFSTNRLSLLDRGFIFAIAHIRGGDDLGYEWYTSGKLDKRINTFNDFVDIAKALIEKKYTSEGKIVISGGSAGGELIGAAINQSPELFGAAAAHVPFVDVLNTMMDESLPLTPMEWPEWGNPITDKSAFRNIQSYSPYDNVREMRYPPLLVTAGLNDPRVTYWEPAKWVAKLRHMKTDNNLLLLKTNMEAGHGGKSGRFDSLYELAEEYTFFLSQLGLIE